MARSRGGTFPRTSVARRKTTWGLGPGGVAATNVTSSSSFFLGSFIVPITLGLTAIRLRGAFSWFLKSATSSGDGFQGAFGVGIATAAAINAGIASVPTPITELDEDMWLYHRIIGVHGNSAAEAEFLTGPATERFEVDSKAMRKFADGMGIYACMEVTEIGTGDANIFFDSRVLVKLP